MTEQGDDATTYVDGHAIRLLNDGAEVFPAMLADIGKATVEVLLEMYWVGEDEVGLAFRIALVRAAQRGCAVRVIIDGFGSLALSAGFWDELLAAGGKVATYHPIGEPTGVALLRSFVSRDHRKVLCLDRKVAYVGGLNLAAPWQPRLSEVAAWRDTAVRLCGPGGANSLADTFDLTWRYLHDHFETPPAPPSLIRLGPQLAILVNSPHKRSGRVIRRLYLWAIRRAQRTIDISAAYFAPRPLFVRALLHAQKRGVRVRILLPFRSDVWLASLASGPLVRYLVRKGVAVYAYRASILHAKTAVIDEKWVTVGSHNLDALSWAWNLECNVAVEDARLGQAMVRTFERDLAHAALVSTTSAPLGLGARILNIAGRGLIAGYRWL